MSSDYSQLSDVAEVIDSLHKTPSYAVQGLPMVRVTDVKYGELLLDGTLKVDEQTFMEFSRRYKPSREDIIITRVGTYGITARVVETAFCLGQNTAAIIPRTINSRYLYAALNSPQLRAQIESNAVGSTQKTLSLKCINALQIPRFGEYAETKIAELIGILDDRITLLRETNATQEAIAQALFKSWFVDFEPVHARARGEQLAGLAPEVATLFSDSFEESALGMIPRGWKVVSVGDVAEVVKGKSYSSKDLVDSHDTALVTLKSFERGGGFRLDGFKPYSGAYKPSQVVVPGDLIIAYTDVTQAAELIGKPAIVVGVENHQTLVASLDVGIVRPVEDNVSRQFLYGLFRTEPFQNHTFAHTSGTTVLHLAKDGVGSFEFACPPVELVKAFTEIADSLAERRQTNIDQMRTLANLRDTLLPRLISGQLRLPDAEQQLKDLAV
ncbi:restriction endonuclease subunit S [Aeromonas veronii]